MNEKMSFWKRMKAYKLDTQVKITVFVLVVFVLALLAYFVPGWRADEVVSNILLALFTSLLVTILTMVTDIVVGYNKHKNDQYLEDIYQFGIETLHRDKKRALKELLAECDKRIWISGYRLILTRDIRKDIREAILRGATVTAVICPPWSQAFQMVYGENEKVMDNYLDCFYTINEAREEMGLPEDKFQIVFVDKPIFNDTYRVDMNLITGPYMHNFDAEFNRLMAKDFFSYNIVRQSKLYQLMYEEYQTLYCEAKWQLVWEEFVKVYNTVRTGDYREVEKAELLKGACKEVAFPPNTKLD